MKFISILFVSIFCLSCTSQKNVPGQTAGSTDSADQSTGNNETKAATPTKNIILNSTESTGNNETKAAAPTKSIILNNTESSEKGVSKNKGEKGRDKLPVCLQKLVKSFLEEDVQNPPRKIYSYIYKGNLVYYVTPPCCDFFSDLYDSQCKLIAHPDGGITGRGDGRARDFTEIKSQEKLVWEDLRRNK